MPCTCGVAQERNYSNKNKCKRETIIEAPRNSPKARCIALTSGKGGVGKSNISTNLAIALAQQGRSVCVFDADTSLANINILLNLTPRLTLEHLLQGSATIDDILLSFPCTDRYGNASGSDSNNPGGISIVPAASGIAEFANLDTSQQTLLLDALQQLENRFDYLLIDTAAGIGNNVTTFLHAAPHCLLVVTPEPTSLTDAFALLKVLRRQDAVHGSQRTVHILTNMTDSYAQSIDLFKRLAGAASKYLEMPVQYFGYIPRDEALHLAVQKQSPVLLSYPGAPISARIQTLAASIDKLLTSQPQPGAFSVFLQKVFLRGLLQKRAAEKPANVQARAAEPARRKYSRALVVRLQQGLAQLIRSRSLPAATMAKLMSSLLQLTGRHYPEISLDELIRPAERTKPADSTVQSQDL